VLGVGLWGAAYSAEIDAIGSGVKSGGMRRRVMIFDVSMPTVRSNRTENEEHGLMFKSAGIRP
jgi:hypothetical protein